MGIRVLSDGKSIRSVRAFVQKCHACCTYVKPQPNGKLKEFCPECGNHTLIRVSVINDSIGMRLLEPRLSKRGTRYSIPLPKGGRAGAKLNLKLSEDTMKQFHNRQYENKRNKQWKNEFENAIEFGTQTHRKPETEDKFGYGRRNPNDKVPKTGNKKKRR